jgi:hypothetical protein
VIGHLLHSLIHPHGWWIVLDVFLFGGTATLGLVINDDDDGE